MVRKVQAAVKVEEATEVAMVRRALAQMGAVAWAVAATTVAP